MDLDPNIAPDMGLDITPIQLSASATGMASVTAMDSNTGQNTDSNTGLVQPDTDIDSKNGVNKGLDPNIGPDSGSDIAPIRPSGLATAIASVMAMDSNTGRNTDSNTVLVQPLASATTDRDINSEKGMTMPLDPNITSDTGSDTMDMTTATDMAKDLESLDPNIASDKGSDTVPIQSSASATAMASVTARHLNQTVDSDDNDSRFSKGSSSEENEFTDDDDVTKAKIKRKLELSSSSRKKDCL